MRSLPSAWCDHLSISRCPDSGGSGLFYTVHCMGKYDGVCETHIHWGRSNYWRSRGGSSPVVTAQCFLSQSSDVDFIISLHTFPLLGSCAGLPSWWWALARITDPFSGEIERMFFPFHLLNVFSSSFLKSWVLLAGPVTIALLQLCWALGWWTAI